jgi:hypothetical protein
MLSSSQKGFDFSKPFLFLKVSYYLLQRVRDNEEYKLIPLGLYSSLTFL